MIRTLTIGDRHALHRLQRLRGRERAERHHARSGQARGARIAHRRQARRRAPTGAKAIVDAEACAWSDHEVRCGKSSQTGAFEINGLPETGGFDLSLTHADHALVVSRIPFGGWWAYDLEIPSHDSVRAFAQASGIEHGLEKGGILFRVEALGYGLTAPLSGGSIKIADHSAVYADAEGRADATLDATSDRGWGVVLGLSPGEKPIHFSHPAVDEKSASCGAVRANGKVAELDQVTVWAGALTVVTMSCVPTHL